MVARSGISGVTLGMRAGLHPHNRFQAAYDFKALIEAVPELARWLVDAPTGGTTMDFSNPEAVRSLNRALLASAYGLKHWEFPSDCLCPAVPGRLDYLFHAAEVMKNANGGKLPHLECLDVGTGASCIYPILGANEWGWKFLASDIDERSVRSAERIVEANSSLRDCIDCRLQVDPMACFSGVVGRGEVIDLTVCNPPFYAHREEADRERLRKQRNLSGSSKGPSNFNGTLSELICDGGEHGFLHRMAKESADWGHRIFYFSALISQQSHVRGLEVSLKKLGATDVRFLPLKTGNKTARIGMWTFLSARDQQAWRAARWS
jgi:23S rRNA (adenine1618-N6)-methyltransferase